MQRQLGGKRHRPCKSPAYGSFRFDASGNFNHEQHRRLENDLFVHYAGPVRLQPDRRRDETDLSTNDYAEFYQRQIVFHYQTMGWTITNLTVINGQAPAFYGRLVVEDGINRLLTLNPTNLIVHGQVTYNHRMKSATEPVPANVLSIGAYTVDHTQTTYQTNSAERIYDARILRVDTHRN